MAIYTAGITVDLVNANVQAKLSALRRALNELTDVYAWLSAYSVADLVTLGFAQADAQDIFNAVADANALARIYSTGLPPSTYPQPPTAYVYAASQRVVTGP